MIDQRVVELEARLEAKLAEAEEYVARLRRDLAALRENPDTAETILDAELQHEAVDNLDHYIEQTTVRWRSVLEFLEEAIAELRTNRAEGVEASALVELNPRKAGTSAEGAKSATTTATAESSAAATESNPATTPTNTNAR